MDIAEPRLTMEKCSRPKTTKKIASARFIISPAADFLHALTLQRVNNVSPLLEKLALMEKAKECAAQEPEPPVSPIKSKAAVGPKLLPPLSQTPSSLICKKNINGDEMEALLFKLDQDIKNVLGSD